MNGFFRRFFFSDFGPPLPPDMSHRPSIAGQNIDEILYSESKYEQAIITRDVSGIYRIHIEVWDTATGSMDPERFGAVEIVALLPTQLSRPVSLLVKSCFYSTRRGRVTLDTLPLYAICSVDKA